VRRPSSGLLAIVIAGLCCPQTLSSAEQWLKLNSSNFELFTTAGEKKGKEALLYFEQVRDVFTKILRSGDAQRLPVRIIAFQSEKEFKPYRINEFAAAFYLSAEERDYIVMQSIGAASFPVATHEYVHLVVKHSGFNPPAWLNEGLADLYSTLKPIGGKVQIGDVIPGRFQLLRASKWLDLETLTAVDHSSPYYNERDRAGIFYAESWALTHMLLLSNEYRPKQSDLMSALTAGQPPGEAFQKVYGKSLQAVQKDLDRYMHGSSFNAGLFDIKLEKAAEKPSAEAATPLQTGTVLAELLSLTHKKQEAQAAYEQLARDNPTNWEVEHALAYLTWRDHRSDVQLKPDYREAHYYLGFFAYNARQYKKAADHFLRMKRIDKDQAFSVYRALAYSHYQLGALDTAKSEAQQLKKYARDAQEVADADDLIEFINRDPAREKQQAGSAIPPGPPESTAPVPPVPTLTRRDRPDWHTYPLQGILRQVDCLGEIARLKVLSAGKEMAFAIYDPRTITIRNSSSGNAELTCGAQQSLAVELEYIIKSDAKLGTIGVIRSLEFK
jgi:tetratricopeptide (TPR) repeat protein